MGPAAPSTLHCPLRHVRKLVDRGQQRQGMVLIFSLANPSLANPSLANPSCSARGFGEKPAKPSSACQHAIPSLGSSGAVEIRGASLLVFSLDRGLDYLKSSHLQNLHTGEDYQNCSVFPHLPRRARRPFHAALTRTQPLRRRRWRWRWQ